MKLNEFNSKEFEEVLSSIFYELFKKIKKYLESIFVAK